MTRIKLSRVLPLLALAFACVGLLSLACGGEAPEFKIGAVLPLSGSAAVYGESIQRGIELAVEQLPAPDSPEALEFTVTTLIEDSAGDPAQAAAKLGEVYDAGAAAAIGGVTSEEALAMVPVADQNDRILLSPTASSPKLSGISPNFFRIFPSATDEANTIARHMLDAQQVTVIAVLYEDDAFGQGTKESIEQAYGGTVAGAIAFAPGTADFADVVAQIKELRSGAELGEDEGFGVYLAATGQDLVAAVKALRQGEISDRIFTTSAIASPQVLESLGEFGERVLFTQTVFDTESTEEPMASFVGAFEAKYGEAPDFYAAHGFDAVNVLVQARKEGGDNLQSEMLKGMRSLSNFPGTTGSIQFRETNDVQKFARVDLIFDGKVHDYEEYMANRRKILEERRRAIEERMRELERRMENPGG